MPSAPPRPDVKDALEHVCAVHFGRFRSAHAKALSGAGPSLFGSDRNPGHWTFDYARREVDDTLSHAAYDLLELAGNAGLEPAALVPQTRARLRAFMDEMFALLWRDYEASSASEYGLRPSRDALRNVQAHGRMMLEAMLAGLSRGVVDPRLQRRVSPVARIAAFVGGTDRLILVVAAVVVLAAILASF